MSKLHDILLKAAFCKVKTNGEQATTDRPQLVMSEAIVKELHNRLCEESGIGQDPSYRTVPASDPHSEYKHPSAEDLPHLMGHLSDQILSSQFTLHPIELAAMAHKRLLDIYPFNHKNEETAIDLMNLLLTQTGYPSVTIPASKSAAYKDALSLSRKTGDMEPLSSLIAECIISAENRPINC